MHDRIQELRRVRADQLLPNVRNWRRHPESQRRALAAVLADVGYAGALLAREIEGGELELIDGHLRADLTPDAIVPVLVLDVTAAEADKIMLSFDPVSAMATADAAKLETLLREVHTEDADLQQLLAHVAERAGLDGARRDTPEVDIPASFQIVVDCADEAAQRELFERLQGEGYSCRVLML